VLFQVEQVVFTTSGLPGSAATVGAKEDSVNNARRTQADRIRVSTISRFAVLVV